MNTPLLLVLLPLAACHPPMLVVDRAPSGSGAFDGSPPRDASPRQDVAAPVAPPLPPDARAIVDAPAKTTDTAATTPDTAATTPDTAATTPDTAATPVYNVYLGQTHAHSDLSRATHDEFPGRDLPDVGFARAKARGADFYFITDHVDSAGSITPADFQRIKSAADAATDARFVAVAGIEYHLDANEVNMFGSDYDAAHKSSRRSSPAYLDYLLGRPGALVQWNHPVRSGEPEQKFDGRTPERDQVAALVELLNGDDTPAAASYQKALDLGWHVAPAAGHDNHGDSWFELPTRTGVLAPALTREAILDAIRNQRVYCSQDPKLKLWYELEGAVMGTTIPPAPSYRATVRTEGATVTRIEIVARGGAVVASGAPTNGIWTAAVPAVTGNFYYARLTSAGGARSWTAPVWVGGPP